MTETGKLMQPTHYQSYLVRLWREDAAAPWRVVVTHVPTGQQQHFASLDACFAYIVAGAETAVSPPNPPTRSYE
jgi:hypothetical protein